MRVRILIAVVCLVLCSATAYLGLRALEPASGTGDGGSVVDRLLHRSPAAPAQASGDTAAGTDSEKTGASSGAASAATVPARDPSLTPPPPPPTPDFSAAAAPPLPLIDGGKTPVQLDGTVVSSAPLQGTLSLKLLFETVPDGRTLQFEPTVPAVVAVDASTTVEVLGQSGHTLTLSDLQAGDPVLASAERQPSGGLRVTRLQVGGSRVLSPTSGAGVSLASDQSAADRSPLVWILGDSMVQDPGWVLNELLRSGNLASVYMDGHSSTGFSSRAYFDWPQHLNDVLARMNPTAAVVVMGANDAQAFTVDGVYRQFGTREWQAAYSEFVAYAMDLLTRDGRRVIWSGMPVMRAPEFGRRMAILNKLYWQGAAAHPGVTYLDSWALLSTPSGGYADRLPGTGSLRAPDGIHFGASGATVLGKALFRQLQAPGALGRPAQPASQPQQPAAPAPAAVTGTAQSHVVVDAVLVKTMPPPTLQSIAPYKQALVAYHYRVSQVIEGKCSQQDILVARWAIRDGKPVPCDGVIGHQYRLVLDPLTDHPEASGERIVQDDNELDLDTYFQVSIQS